MSMMSSIKLCLYFQARYISPGRGRGGGGGMQERVIARLPGDGGCRQQQLRFVRGRTR